MTILLLVKIVILVGTGFADDELASGFYGLTPFTSSKNTESPNRWDGLTQYTSYKGSACVSPCEYRGEDYLFCYTKESAFDYTEGEYCSQIPHTDYKGHICIFDCVASYSYFTEVYVCDTSSGVQYCGKTLNYVDPIVVGLYKTIYGKYCISECTKAGELYNWCYKEGGGWDYCSATGGYDRYDKKCRNTCDYHGEKYMWCWKEEGGWDYCGDVEVSSETQFTLVGSKCLTPCTPQPNSDNTCYDATMKQLACSMFSGLAANNKECAHPCSLAGGNTYDSISQNNKIQPYYWCWTEQDMSEWHYCSIPKDDLRERESGENVLEKLIPGLSRFSSQIQNWNRRDYYPKASIPVELTRNGSLVNVYRHIDNQSGNRVTFFELMDRNGNNAQYPVNDQIREWAFECLNNWHRQRGNFISEGCNTETLANGGGTNRHGGPNGVRLDQQSRYDRDGTQYVNLQLQVNGVSRSNNRGRSTTVAEVQVPVDVVADSSRRVLEALRRSLLKHFAVHIARFEYDPPRKG